MTSVSGRESSFTLATVVVNDLYFHKFDDVYRKVMIELDASACPRGAIGDLLDRWIGNVESALIAGGEDEGAPDFDETVHKRLDEDLASMTGRQS
jgi:hypothetical protein